MALFMKQDFTPPMLSRRWVAIKFRPNMLLHSRQNIIQILESGLLFREDSIEVEQEAPTPEEVWGAAGGGRRGWMTRGEGMLTAAALAVCVCVCPPRSFSRSALINLSIYASIPVAIRSTHRALSRGGLSSLLRCMRDYLALARRAAACLKEYAALHTQIGSLSSVIESTHTMLCRQQSELAIVMSRASSAVLGNAPWLRDDVAWDAVERDGNDGLMKIHHAFLVVQSTLLKHIAMVHYIPAPNLQKLYKNHNERLYWIHKTLVKHLLEEFTCNFEALDRMYRLLKNSANRDDSDRRKLGTAVNTNWIYSEVHTGIARANLELKVALSKSNGLDMFLDSCAVNDQKVDLAILDKDVDDLIEDITRCLKTVQNSQIRLKRLKGKLVECAPVVDEGDSAAILEKDAVILKIEDKQPETRDEVFYFVKTEDDAPILWMEQPTAAPGKKEKEMSKIVLNELKRKLGKREDLMRERERQALLKTMPELKNIPEFPRQIKFDEYIIRKGYISKIFKKANKKRLFRHYKIHSKLSKSKIKVFAYKVNECVNEGDVNGTIYEANALLNIKSRLFTIICINKEVFINVWCKATPFINFTSLDHSGAEASTSNKNMNQTNALEVKLKYTKKGLDLTDSSSDSDFEYHQNKRELLNDIRRHRAVRKKNHPSHREKPTIDNEDESLKPIEYSFGTGLAMASVLQVNNAKFLNMEQEEVFNGDGEVSNDSGNDEDA